MRKRAAVLPVTAVAAAAAVLVPSIATRRATGDTAITSVVVNHGRSVVIGATAPVSFPVTVTATDDSGIASVGPVGVWGPKYGVLTVARIHCVPLSATTSRCTGTATADPSRHQTWNDEAGSWYVDARVDARDGDHYENPDAAGFSLKRAAHLWIGTAPAHARAGRPVTVRGYLSRAWWDDNHFHGCPDSQVRLQFRPAGSDTYTTVATATSDILGRVAARVVPAGPGTYQWYFSGNKSTDDAVSVPLPVAPG